VSHSRPRPPIRGKSFLSTPWGCHVTPLHVDVGHCRLTAVTVTDDRGVVLPGALDPRGLTWTASVDLAYGTTYSVAATAIDAGGTSRETAGTVTTVSPRMLTMPTVFPSADTGAGPTLQAWDGYGDWNEDWADWRAGSALAQPVS
jgi:hypothetical protein